MKVLNFDGTIYEARAGSASQPGISFAGDLNTGIYSPGADQLAISTNGQGRLFVDSSGRCGIGTSSPSSYDFNGPAVLAVANTAGSSTLTIASDASSLGQIAFADGTSSTARYRGLLEYNHLTDSLQIRTAAIPAITIDSSQRVGIGSTGPNRKLVISNNGAECYEIGPGESSNLNQEVHFNRSTSVYVTKRVDAAQHIFNSATGEVARIDSSGRLLVGTSSASTMFSGASANLQVQNTSSTFAVGIERATNDTGAGYIVFRKTRSTSPNGVTVVQSGDSIGNLTFAATDGNNPIAAAVIEAQVDGTPGANDMPGRLVFSTTADGASSPTERGRITNAGYWKLTSNNTYVSSAGAFHEIVHGATGSSVVVSAENASFAAGVMQLRANRATTDSTFNALEYYNAGSAAYRFFVRDSGNVQNTNNSYGAISDIKLKENIVDANSQWGDIKALQVRNYNFKEGQTHTQIGLIAQEVELVSPGLVNESPDRDEDGNDLGTVTKSINYSVLYMKAVKALQEAMERIEALEAKVAALEGN